MAAFKKFEDLISLAKSDAPCKFCLIYGPDFWINSNLINKLSSFITKTNNNLEIAHFNEDDINNNFSSFETSIRGASLFGGSTLAILKVYNDSTSNKIIQIIDDFEKSPNRFSGGLFVVGNGLSNKSKIVHTFEKAKEALSLRLYPPTRLDLIRIVQDKAKEENVTIEKNTIEILLNNVSNDSASLISQVENLALYVGSGAVIDEAAVYALNINSKEGALDQLLNFAFLGRTNETIIASFQIIRNNLNPILILNSIIRRIDILISMLNELSNGKSSDEIVKDRKFNVFWKEQDNFKKLLNIWRISPLLNILIQTINADETCKKSGSMQVEIVERLLMRISETAKSLSRTK